MTSKSKLYNSEVDVDDLPPADDNFIEEVTVYEPLHGDNQVQRKISE